MTYLSKLKTSSPTAIKTEIQFCNVRTVYMYKLDKDVVQASLLSMSDLLF